jgi:hypothetical protein
VCHVILKEYNVYLWAGKVICKNSGDSILNCRANPGVAKEDEEELSILSPVFHKFNILIGIPH